MKLLEERVGCKSSSSSRPSKRAKLERKAESDSDIEVVEAVKQDHTCVYPLCIPLFWDLERKGERKRVGT